MVYPLITLYSSEEEKFETNGLGSLAEATSCKVTEEANGQFELEMNYPVHGRRFQDLQLRRIVFTKPNPVDPPQGFRIYEITKPMNGIVTVRAAHLRYDLTGYPVTSFEASTCSTALIGLKEHSLIEHPFTFWTDKETTADFSVATPLSTTSALGGTEGSILDVYGGEYKFDNFTVRLYNHRGLDRGVSIRYGKNLTDLKQEENCSSVYTHVFPYWESEDSLVTVTEPIKTDGDYDFVNVLILDLSSEFEDPPYEEDLIEVATEYIKENDLGKPTVSLTVSFAQLEQTEEYKDVALLERVELFDTVSVEFPELGVSATAKVNQTVYNPLTSRYESVSLGDIRANISDTIIAQDAYVDEAIDETKSFLERSSERATNWITNGKGYMVAVRDEGGNWKEICSLDTPDINSAINVWRWNNGGFGFSSNGYNGPYKLAMTQDGHINADFIDVGSLTANIIKTGILNADLIRAGVLSSVDEETFYLDLVQGILRMKATELTITGKTIPEIVNQAAQNYTSFVVSLDNEYQGISVDSSGLYHGTLSASTKAQASYGSNDVTYDENCYFQPEPSSSITGRWNENSKTYTVTGLSADEGYVDILATYELTGIESGKILTATKRFTVRKVRDGGQGAAGENARDYILELSSTALKRGSGGAITPSSLTAYTYYRDGTSTTRYSYSGRIRFQTSTNGTSFTTVSTSSSNESSRTYSLSSLSTSIVSIRVILYAAGGTTSTLDMVTIPIVADAASLSQRDIFNILTNNGVDQGIYLQNGRIYINAEYIGSGQISADRIDTDNLVAGKVNSTNGQYWAKIVNGRFSGGYNYSTENGYLDLTSNVTMNNKPLYPVLLRAYNNMVLWADDDIRIWSQYGTIQIMRSATGVGWLHIAGTVESNYGYGFINYFYIANGPSLGFYDSTGSVHFVNISSSDVRRKRNIEESDIRAIDVINAIGHCSFDYVDDEKEHWDCGYIAQQLEQIRPEFVRSAPNKDEDGNDTDKYSLFVNDFAILCYATKAIQELSEENDILKSRCESLEQRVEKLEQLVQTLIH